MTLFFMMHCFLSVLSFEQLALNKVCVFTFIIMWFTPLLVVFRMMVRTSSPIVDGGLFGGLERIA